MTETSSSPPGEPVRLTDGIGRERYGLQFNPGGRQRALLLHATGFNAVCYTRFLTELTERRPEISAVAVDQRGHGFCPLPADPDRLRSWEVFVQDLLRLLEAEPEPVLLMGHSLGGAVVLQAAAEMPDRVAGVVALDPVLVPGWRWLLNLGLIKNPMAAVAARRRRHYDSADQVLESYRGRGAFADWPEAVLRDYLAGGLRPVSEGKGGEGGEGVELCCSPAWESQCFQKSGVFARRRWLRRLACPVRILKPEHLSTMQVPSVERALRRRPETRIEIIPGG
ncbi:MAG: alpha/beta hydrolase, partial [Gammaproteobacteria bacterium AqS3]|nr:alpha/beta hydrolase [Gammaproteobacteria bacterium AqS3]